MSLRLETPCGVRLRVRDRADRAPRDPARPQPLEPASTPKWKAQAAAQAQVVATARPAATRGEIPPGFAELVRQACETLGARVIVVDARGRPPRRLRRNRAPPDPRPRNRPEIAAALAGRSRAGDAAQRHARQRPPLHRCAGASAGGPPGAVRVTQSVDAVGARVRRNVLVVIGVGLVALALGLAPRVGARRRLLARPLRAPRTHCTARSRTVSSTRGLKIHGRPASSVRSRSPSTT